MVLGQNFTFFYSIMYFKSEITQKNVIFLGDSYCLLNIYDDIVHIFTGITAFFVEY